MKSRTWTRLGSLLVALSFLTLGTACHRSPEAKVDKMSEKIARKLDLNTEQKAMLNDITSDFKKDMAEEKAIRNSKANDFRQMVMSDNLDKAKVKADIMAREQRMNSRLDRYLDKVAALHKTLNPEQKKEIVEEFNKMQGKW